MLIWVFNKKRGNKNMNDVIVVNDKMFAEFDKCIHQCIQRIQPSTPKKPAKPPKLEVLDVQLKL
jgi:hypothetical protein